MSESDRVSMKLRDGEIVIETGKYARQANGAVMITYGGTTVLVPVTASKKPVEGLDYFPLTVNYQERIYAAGKIPGGFFKREGRPTVKEILVSRLIDRPIRPLFPEGFRNEVQILPMTVSADQINPPDVLAIVGSSAALMVSDIPFKGPIGAVRVGKVNGELIVNPTYAEIDESTINIVVAGTKNGVLMVEGESKEVSEDEMIEAVEFAHKNIVKLVELQEELLKKISPVEKMSPPLYIIDERLKEDVEKEITDSLKEVFNTILSKKERNERIEKLYEDVLEKMEEKYGEEIENVSMQIKDIFKEVEKEIVRRKILEEGKRIDGRGLKDIRPISIEIGILPRTHGSAIFTRGETQSLGVTTLGTVDDEQRFDDIEGEETSSFMLHYNFPPFSVGETGRVGAPSRREIGHGMLAQRALEAVLPPDTEFPYTIRIVSEILESNGSSSMATVCSGCLSLLDAGVPIKASVAGVAMGLILESNDKYAILTDILGEEDHLGDMDFKVAGTRDGITAFQMDIKIDSITFDIMKKALAQAKEGRYYILDKMDEVIKKPHENLSEYAPKIKTLQIPKEKIAIVIGPGGSNIKKIIQETDTNIFIDENGVVNVSGKKMENVDKAIEIIKDMTTDLEVGEIYKGKVVRIADFGAFISLPGRKDGLLHISKIANRRIKQVSDVLEIGQEVNVKVINIDDQGRINLSMKDVKQDN